ncbi:MAG: hypothetical protein J5895_00390 [Alphaproteobacteria bacterium]|nr:hypothetical protein [Alphaproteobacteria bacterium]MBQ7659787.1 hypothetical protein [Alphaproteobacteria bacterium]
MTIQRQIRKQLGRLIFDERRKNNTYSAACCRALKINPITYERIELGSRHIGWKKFEDALKYFHKSIEIRLVDEEKSNKNA